MREPGVALAGAISRDIGGLAIVSCPDLDLRERLVRQVESLIPTDADAFRTASVAEALRAPLGRDRTGEALNLTGLPEHMRAAVALERAALTVLLRFNRRDSHLQELAVMLTGARHDDSPWALAVHLPHDQRGDRDGHGACGHAALHCHIGPTLDIKPKVRVPFPALRPAQILEWAIAQVVPTPEFEPAPWPGTRAMLRSP